MSVRVRIEKGIFLVGDKVVCEHTENGRMVRRVAPMQGSLALNARNQPTKALRDWKRDFDAQVRNAEWEKLDAARVRNSYPEIGRLLEVYRDAAARELAATGQPRERTAKEGAASFVRLVRACGLAEGDKVSALTRDAVSRAVAGYVGEDGDEGRRIGAWSMVRQARSVLARWTRPYYEAAGVNLPKCLDEWPREKLRTWKLYVRPPEELRKATAEWYGKLSGQKWVAATLVFQLGMRPVDAAVLTWDAFRDDGVNGVWLNYVPSKVRGRTAGGVRTVKWPVMCDVYARLRQEGGKEFVVPGASSNERYETFVRKLTRDMRGIGWAPEKYGKGCYELRKLCVDAVYRAFGAERASQISGDNISTVMRAYADPNSDRVEPVDIGKIV